MPLYGQLSIDIGAYGENVISSKALNNNYATFSGTSFASPQVSSAVALSLFNTMQFT
ncbi:MAG: S8 family serine peptidase [Saprospiraceae bacterium]|nr:S8 family serine peptidase [Saprospiraceae bacterium]